MGIFDPFVLPSDVVVAPVRDLPLDIRQHIEHQTGDYYVTRPRTRTVSSLVDPQTVALLQFFRKPATIVDAVLAFCSAETLNPEHTLETAFGPLAVLIEEGVLVPAHSGLAQPIVASLHRGLRVDGVELIEPVHLLSDTEVYRARLPTGTAVALKIASAEARSDVIASIRHEAAILGLLDGTVSPRLIRTGVFRDRPFLVIAWHVGADLYQAATEARTIAGSEGRDELLHIVGHIIGAYAHLHAQGVLHGDVHPHNVLIGPRHEVTVLDYGLAVAPAAGLSCLRGGVDLFRAPELLRRIPASEPPPLSTVAEQYSLSALLYLCLTGGYTHSFSLMQEEMRRQVIEDPQLPFAAHGVNDLPAVEACLRRALAKDPTERYPSLDALREAFHEAAAHDRRNERRPPKLGAARADHGKELLDAVLARVCLGGGLLNRGLEPPTASVAGGGAGLAYALLRISRYREDEELLALADVWSTRAVAAVGTNDAVKNAQYGIVPETFGQHSLLHHAAGVYCVQSLVAHARGDDETQQLGVDAFVAEGEHCEELDFAFGRAGLLVGCTMLLDVLPEHPNASSLRSLGKDLLGSLSSQVAAQSPLTADPHSLAFGAAHGWVGILFATLQWCEVANAPVPPELEERLDELASLAQPAGRGLRWPRTATASGEDSLLAASWCNGSAGYVYLWTLAHRRWGDERFERLARMAAWSTYEGWPDASGDLCCGLAGRSYALLCLYKHNREPQWLARARILAERAVARPGVQQERLHSLYHGEVGIALLAADLQTPDFACMPLFEAEGWPPSAQTGPAPQTPARTSPQLPLTDGAPAIKTGRSRRGATLRPNPTAHVGTCRKTGFWTYP